MGKVLNPKPWDGDENTPNSLGRLAAKMLRELSEPIPSGEYVKTTIDRVGKLSKLDYWRTFDLWYSKARKVEPYELEKITDAIELKNERDAANELRDLKARLMRLESALNAGDSNFHSPTIAHARELVRRLGGVGRPLDGRGCA